MPGKWHCSCKSLFISSTIGGEMKPNQEKKPSNCETCTYFTYDEDYEAYVCDRDMDEDEYVRLMSDTHYSCPYYRCGDEYLIVRHQM